MPSIQSATVIGIDALPVSIETDIAFGLSSFTIVGLPDTTVKESRDRIRSAIRNAGYPFPRVRITVNLAPADVKKQGPLYDVPIAVSILLTEGEFGLEEIDRSLILGELGLDGNVRPVSGVLAIAILARHQGVRRLFLPTGNAPEAACVPDLEIIPIDHLKTLVQYLKKEKTCVAFSGSPPPKSCRATTTDFAHIKGQWQAKRGLEIAAAGGHNLLLLGPPGTGKTLLARSLPSILPSLTPEESLEVTAIASVAGYLHPGDGLMSERPFRTPHHSASPVALIGGGSWPKPGEVSLAHRGVLFLDELPEFSRAALEYLRQPLEDGVVTISRANARIAFPARFLLCAAMNPCPCGYATDRVRPCVCSPAQRARYQHRISGPLLDRFDLMIEAPPVGAKDLFAQETAESSGEVRKRVEEARRRQEQRKKRTHVFTNAELMNRDLETWCPLSSEGTMLLSRAVDKGHLSARGVTRVKKVARTIADLARSETIELPHLAEALQYRPRSLREID